jgi:hypothetical protein
MGDSNYVTEAMLTLSPVFDITRKLAVSAFNHTLKSRGIRGRGLDEKFYLENMKGKRTFRIPGLIFGGSCCKCL